MKKVVIITGGTRGIGLGIAIACLKEGYRVALNYHSDDKNAEKALKELASKDAICIKGDITQNDERERLLSEVSNHFGGFDILVNNAGIIRKGRILDIKEDDYQQVMKCNLDAPIFLAQAFANSLIETKRSGSIINILSVGAHKTGNLAYCTAKAALLMATKCMARELGKHHIRVNSISPYGVATELNRANREANPESWKEAFEKLPISRTSDPEEIGSAVIYLVSESASYVTGIDIPVDGGYLTKT